MVLHAAALDRNKPVLLTAVLQEATLISARPVTASCRKREKKAGNSRSPDTSAISSVQRTSFR